MRDPAQGVKDILVSAGVGVFNASSGWSIHIGALPKTPDTVILLNNAGGRSPFPHLRLNFPNVQVLVRGAESGYQAAVDKIEEAADKLIGLPVQLIAGDEWKSCRQLSDVLYLGQDINGRPQLTASFTFIIESATGTYRSALS